MTTIIHEHAVDLELLPEKAIICDLGCRGFGFTNHFRDLGHTVISVDIDDLQHGYYHQCAISNYTGKCGIWKNNDPQATKIGAGDSIDCFTLPDFMSKVGVEFFDLIKCDIEGAEYEVIMSLTKAPAKQISVEFHMHCGQTKEQVAECVTKLESLGYEIASHELTTMHGAGYNYWQSLFILK